MAGALLLAALCSAAPRVQAAAATFTNPSLDKWLYGNVPGQVGGESDAAPTFAILNTDDDDRLGSMLVGFQTSNSILPGQGVQNYSITSVRLKLAVLSGNTFFYDPTHDTVDSYPTGGVDLDTGRPVEVFGVGLRTPYTSLSPSVGGAGPSQYHENSPFGNGSGQPYAYPLALNPSGQLFDAMDNVSDLLEAIPFGVGVADLTPGDLVPADTVFTFTLDISSPAVLAYIRQALNSGMLGLHVSSLHFAQGQGGPQTYPRYYTKEGAIFAPELAPRLEIEYEIVPEPRVSGLLIAGIALFAAGRGLRHRHRMS